MKKKTYYVHDGENQFRVEEVDADENIGEPLPPAPEEDPSLHDDESFDPALVEVLKRFANINIDGLAKLAENADALIALLDTHANDEEGEVGEEAVLDEDCGEEQVIDSEDPANEKGENVKSHDSFKLGYGANRKPTKTADAELAEDEVVAAWAKRYNGGNQ